MRYFLLILFVTALLTVQSCSENKEKITTENNIQYPVNSSFKLAIVTADQPSFPITLPGELMPYEQVSIYPKIKGFIKKIYVDRGSYVHKGQVLAKLEAPEIGEQYSARQSASSTSYQKYLFSKHSWQRLKVASRKSGAVAAIELDKAYTQLLGDSAAYQSSRSEASASGKIKDYLTITAPFSGIVTGRFVSEGALVGDNTSKSEPMFELAQQDKLRLTIAIPEKEAQSLPVGSKATFTVVDFPGKTFTANLSRSSGALEVSSRSVIAEFDILNSSIMLRAGQYAKVTIQLKRAESTLWVPATSVVQAQSGIFVIKVKNKIARRIPVQIGVSKDSLMEVFGNILVNDTLLLKGSEEVKEGIKISNNM